MKTGKPGKAVAPPATKKPAAPPAAKANPSAAPATPAAKSSAKPSPKAAASTDDDDPFGVDTALASRAIALSPRPAKGKTVRLICPMCETPGFAGTEAAGKEVKCCNEKCALPIFTAPKAEAEQEASADPRGAAASASPAKKTSAPLIATAVGTMVLAAGSVWYFVFNDAGPKPVLAPPPPAYNPSLNQNTTATDPNESSKNKTETKSEKSAAEKAIELRAQILPVIVELSRQTDKNRSKHLCRRLAADAFVEAGDFKSARENLDQLLTLPPKFPFHRVIPLAHMAWRESASGKGDAAKGILDEALKAAAELPESGRLTFDAKTELAALLFHLGRANEAKELLNKIQSASGSWGQLSALLRRVELLQTFDLDEGIVSLPIIPWKKPEWVVTTVTLVLRGESAAALECIKAAPDAEIKADCFAAWGDAMVVAPKSTAKESDDAIAAALKEQSPATQGLVWARVAAARAAAGAKDSAGKAIAQAASAGKSIAAPMDFILPDTKELSRLQLADPVPPRLNAIALAEVARAQTSLGQTKEAAESLTAALQHLRGQAPSLPAAQRRFDATARESAAEIKAELKKLLNLKTDDQVNQALTQYRAKCQTILNAANARFRLQADLLKSAIDWPLVDTVWELATARAAASTPEETREEFLKTQLSVRLGQRLRAANKTDLARQCETAATNGGLTDARDALERDTSAMLDSGNVAGMAKSLIAYLAKPAEPKGAAAPDDADWPTIWIMRLAGRLVKQKKTDSAFEFLAAFTKDMALREEGYALIAARTAKEIANAEQLWKKYRPSLLTPTEKVSLFRGLCAGLSQVATTTK